MLLIPQFSMAQASGGQVKRPVKKQTTTTTTTPTKKQMSKKQSSSPISSKKKSTTTTVLVKKEDTIAPKLAEAAGYDVKFSCNLVQVSNSNYVT